MRLAAAVVVALAAWPSRPPAQTTDSPPSASEPAPKARPSAPATGSAKPPPAAATELARALLTEEQWSKVLDSYASSLAGQVSEALLSRGEKVPDDLRARLRGELGRALPYQQTVQAQAEALGNELTPDELKKTAAFYRSPLGRKVLERLPEAQSSVAQELQGRLATAVPDIVNRVAPKAMAAAPAPGGGGKPGSSPGGAGQSPPPAQSPPVQGRRPPEPGGGH